MGRLAKAVRVGVEDDEEVERVLPPHSENPTPARVGTTA
jgi:hypothetical protein